MSGVDDYTEFNDEANELLEQTLMEQTADQQDEKEKDLKTESTYGGEVDKLVNQIIDETNKIAAQTLAGKDNRLVTEFKVMFIAELAKRLKDKALHFAIDSIEGEK